MEVDWRPFYLYWDTPQEGRELPEHVKKARAAGSEERLTQLAASFGMPFVSTRRIYNTRLAHEATEYTRDQGKLIEFHRIVFRKVYGEGQISASGMCYMPRRKRRDSTRRKCS